ncbi:MAG: hypothetical protein L6V81_09170 [Clostridium sp.]|nr:MAG: hypothetical protein L6V81_09170 [Clostridium sp.]
MTRLNADHDCINYIHDDGNLISQKCYAKATMMGINDARYYDSIDKSNITNMYQNSFPVYMYNSILTLPSKNEKMQYAALGRFFLTMLMIMVIIGQNLKIIILNVKYYM